MPAQPAAAATPALDWFASARGARLLACESQGLGEIGLRCRGGRALILCGSASAGFALEMEGPRAQLCFGYDQRNGRLGGGLCAAIDALPFCRESFGLILAWHLPSQAAFSGFDFAEAAELLQPEGEILLVGLNPLSAWRLHWQRYGLVGMRPGALRSRLDAAGLEVRAVRGLGPRWPWGGGEPAPAVVQSPQLCASVLVQLRKRRPGLTPLPARRALATARASMT
jgi:hypothetical protein